MCVEHAGSRGLNIRWFDHRDRVAKCFHFKTRFVGSKVFMPALFALFVMQY
jgi:hypothetical protein